MVGTESEAAEARGGVGPQRPGGTQFKTKVDAGSAPIAQEARAGATTADGPTGVAAAQGRSKAGDALTFGKTSLEAEIREMNEKLLELRGMFQRVER